MAGFDDEVRDDFVEGAHRFGQGVEGVAVGVEEAADWEGGWGGLVGWFGGGAVKGERDGEVGERYVRLRS